MKHSVDRCRSRLRGMHYGTLEQQRGAMKHVGGSGETYMETRRQLLKVILHYIASLRFVGWWLFSFLLPTYLLIEQSCSVSRPDSLLSFLACTKALAHPSVVCNVRAPYSGGSNFLQYFYGIRYLGHPLTSTENFMEIVRGEPLHWWS